MGVLRVLRLLCLGDGAYLWVISDVQSIPGATIDGEIGSSMGKWIGALLGFLVLSIVGALLGGIAWYTRPRRLEQEEQR